MLTNGNLLFVVAESQLYKQNMGSLVSEPSIFISDVLPNSWLYNRKNGEEQTSKNIKNIAP